MSASVSIARTLKASSATVRARRCRMGSLPVEIWRDIIKRDAGDAGDDDEADDWMLRQRRLLELSLVSREACTVAQEALSKSLVIRKPTQCARVHKAIERGQLAAANVAILSIEHSTIGFRKDDIPLAADILNQCQGLRSLRLAGAAVFVRGVSRGSLRLEQLILRRGPYDRGPDSLFVDQVEQLRIMRPVYQNAAALMIRQPHLVRRLTIGLVSGGGGIAEPLFKRDMTGLETLELRLCGTIAHSREFVSRGYMRMFEHSDLLAPNLRTLEFSFGTCSIGASSPPVELIPSSVLHHRLRTETLPFAETLATHWEAKIYPGLSGLSAVVILHAYAVQLSASAAPGLRDLELDLRSLTVVRHQQIEAAISQLETVCQRRKIRLQLTL